MMTMKRRISRLATLPLLALRGMVVFPKTTVHLDIRREQSIQALQSCMDTDQCLFAVMQQNIAEERPNITALCKTGVVLRIRQVLRTSPDTIHVVAEGLYRARINCVVKDEAFYTVQVRECLSRSMADKETEAAFVRELRSYFGKYAEFSGGISSEDMLPLLSEQNALLLADRMTDILPAPAEEKQKVLDSLNAEKRLHTLLKLLADEIEILELERGIEQQVQANMEKNQRDYYLHEQMKVIASQLGEADDPMGEADELRAKIKALSLPKESEEKLLKECDKLAKMPFGSHEATVVRNYLDVCLNLPWNITTKEKQSLEQAKKVLDRDHYGLTKVKERILEVLAVRKLTGGTAGQVICLVGPPGVGKTSIAKSIAEALGRQYVRVSLGGVRDEAEIRGHRKTYIGSMPGRLIQAITKAKSNNPVILLDEIDKLGNSHNGDPCSALLEVLDTEQNHAFVDHYVEIPYDLSGVLFITTANNAENIPAPLFDRMDVINLSSYTTEEKFRIARDHLIRKQLKANGLTARQLRFSDAAIYAMIDGYTREGGVRNLERSLSKICRQCAQKIVSDTARSVSVTDKNLHEFLGPRRFKEEQESKMDEVGVVNGLAWTAVGGETMPIEVAVLNGTGKIELTGSLGDVMKESAKAAVSYVRATADRWNIEQDFYKTKDIHIHVPEGAVPKDGPSAGVTMATALVSALTDTPVRHDVAMTGEISLRGRVLPIGGLKEKTMAAYRHHLTTVVIPQDNEADLAEIDEVVKQNVKFVTARNVETVIKTALR